MDTELYIHPKATNNNPPIGPRKKWSTSSIPGLESLEEVIETEYKESFATAPQRELTGLEDKRGRRKSWHVGKFERKRRKGVAGSGSGSVSPPSGSEAKYDRQKRHSWWTIFVPEHLTSR